MICILNGISDRFGAWAESCPCHDWLHPMKIGEGRERGESAFRADAIALDACRKQLRLPRAGADGLHHHPCPLGGCRAVELASGSIEELFEIFCTLCAASLLELTEGLSPEEVAKLMDDFAASKAAMISYLEQKLQCWKTLPWHLAAVGHRNLDKARWFAKECLRVFDALPQDPALHHRLTLRALARGSVMRLEMEAFAESDRPMSDFPLLSRFIWEFRFLPTVERVQERDHSTVHHEALDRNVGGAYVACSLRFVEVEDIFLHQQHLVEDLLKYFQGNKRPDDMAKRLGFFRHPAYQEAIAEKFSSRKKLQLAEMLMYNLDGESQFAKMKGAATLRNKRRGHREAQEKAWRKQFETKQKFS